MKFTQEDRKDLVWSMRKTLLDHVRSNKGLTESKRISAENFIVNEATYEQLLNLVYNPERDSKYQSASVLEGVALESYKTFISEAAKVMDKSKVKTEGNVFEAVFLEYLAPGQVAQFAGKEHTPVANAITSTVDKAATGLKTGVDKATTGLKTGVEKSGNMLSRAGNKIVNNKGKTALAVGGTLAALGTAKYLSNRHKAKKAAAAQAAQ